MDDDRLGDFVQGVDSLQNEIIELKNMVLFRVPQDEAKSSVLPRLAAYVCMRVYVYMKKRNGVDGC